MTGRRNTAARTFLVLALVSGTVVSAAVLAWAFDVISLGAFLAVIAVVGVVEVVVLVRAAGRTRMAEGSQMAAGAARARADSSAARAAGGHARVNTMDTSGTDEVGYDPMAGFRGPNDPAR